MNLRHDETAKLYAGWLAVAANINSPLKGIEVRKTIEKVWLEQITQKTEKFIKKSHNGDEIYELAYFSTMDDLTAIEVNLELFTELGKLHIAENELSIAKSYFKKIVKGYQGLLAVANTINRQLYPKESWVEKMVEANNELVTVTDRIKTVEKAKQHCHDSLKAKDWRYAVQSHLVLAILLYQEKNHQKALDYLTAAISFYEWHYLMSQDDYITLSDLHQTRGDIYTSKGGFVQEAEQDYKIKETYYAKVRNKNQLAQQEKREPIKLNDAKPTFFYPHPVVSKRLENASKELTLK